MTRFQSEAIASIISAVAPLPTKADLGTMKKQMATKTDLEAIDTKFENVNARIESTKHWLSSRLQVIVLNILVLPFG